MKIILEAEWEAEDIVNYCRQNQIECCVMNQTDIFEMQPTEFFQQPVFCNTLIMQKNLKSVHKENLIPDTYDLEFKHLFKRVINMVTFKDLAKYRYPYFIKSIGNSKLVDGTVIKNSDDLADVWVVNQVFPKPDLLLYLTEVVKFDVEYRLLVGNSRIYGIGHQKGSKSITISSDHPFIKDILTTAGMRFLCIDIGYISECKDCKDSECKEWAIVEINPPFSLDDFDIPVQIYVQYGLDFWINNH